MKNMILIILCINSIFFLCMLGCSANDASTVKYNKHDIEKTNHKPVILIPDADLLYNSAGLQEKEAKSYGTAFINKNKLEKAFNLYVELIEKFPESDKIDDAAYKAGEIAEYFKNYNSALEFYQRAYEWDPNTPNPAMFKAAIILDKYMRRYSEALDLYRKAISLEGKFSKNREFKNYSEERIRALEK